MAGHVVIDRELCLGSGMCLVYAPNTFAHDEQSKAVIVDPAGDSAEEIDTAVDACPVGALTWAPGDDTGGATGDVSSTAGHGSTAG
ncbi:ferredoxin [Frankia sp. AgPm24]|uniref:ferredoxin n=1 Tax=Frankia sp. AgPm24 TaxID=631128 RepID=UPI00200D643E|nr:ferredoxin [Frankia sp. AgPm24]MCK9922978.1 ferredoxin [Frankia sp. AgPm24]